MAINLPEDIETGKITVDYTATVLEKTAYAISAISIVGFTVYMVCFRKKWKKEEQLNLPKEKIV